MHRNTGNQFFILTTIFICDLSYAILCQIDIQIGIEPERQFEGFEFEQVGCDAFDCFSLI